MPWWIPAWRHGKEVFWEMRRGGARVLGGGKYSYYKRWLDKIYIHLYIYFFLNQEVFFYSFLYDLPSKKDISSFNIFLEVTFFHIRLNLSCSLNIKIVRKCIIAGSLYYEGSPGVCRIQNAWGEGGNEGVWGGGALCTLGSHLSPLLIWD